MRVAFSGLTAAGKTTHSQLLARELGARWLSATEMLAEMVGVDMPRAGGLWLSDAAEQIERAREGDEVDRELDTRLCETFARENNVVADAWALPWLMRQDDAICVWLESDLASRSRKCLVSQLPKPLLSLDESRFHITRKDASTRERFMRLYAFDLFEDRRPFDVILDNSALIEHPTRSAADAGIATFAPVVAAAVRCAAGPICREDAFTLTNSDQNFIVTVKGWKK